MGDWAGESWTQSHLGGITRQDWIAFCIPRPSPHNRSLRLSWDCCGREVSEWGALVLSSTLLLPTRPHTPKWPSQSLPLAFSIRILPPVWSHNDYGQSLQQLPFLETPLVSLSNLSSNPSRFYSRANRSHPTDQTLTLGRIEACTTDTGQG